MPGKMVQVLGTWHPAGVMKDKARMMRGFLLHCEKAAKIAKGKKPDRKPRVITNPSVVETRRIMKKWKRTAFDIETVSLSDHHIKSIAASGEFGVALVWDLEKLGSKKLLVPLRELLADPKRMKIAHNGDFDIRILRNVGWKIAKHSCWDSMLDAGIRFPDEPVNLSFLVSLACDIHAWKHTRRGNLLIYNGYDANYDWRLDAWLRREYGENTYVTKRMSLLENVIIPYNSRGMMLDKQKHAEFVKVHAERIKTWRKRAQVHFKELSLGELPIGKQDGFSSKKLQVLLYETLELPVKRNVKTGSITCDRNALNSLKKIDQTGTIDLLLERSREKTPETALQVVPDADGRVRTRFVLGGDEKHDDDQVGKESPGSGRLASREPNLHNVPEWVRAIYIPRSSRRVFLKSDYSQIEPTVTAHLSKDPELRRAVETDVYLYSMLLIDQHTDLYKLHKWGFEELLRMYQDEDPKVVIARRESKTSFLGWSYRMGARKLELQRGVPYKRGKLALEALSAKYFYVPIWWHSLEKEVFGTSEGSGQGYLTNPFGRTRNFFADDAPAFCAFKPSSVAADILFDSMEILEKELKRFDTEAVMTLHDELVFDTAEEDLIEVAKIVREVMEEPIPQLDNLSIPVNFSVGHNWAKYHKHSRNCKAYCFVPENLKGCRSWDEEEGFL